MKPDLGSEDSGFFAMAFWIISFRTFATEGFFTMSWLISDRPYLHCLFRVILHVRVVAVVVADHNEDGIDPCWSLAGGGDREAHRLFLLCRKLADPDLLYPGDAEVLKAQRGLHLCGNRYHDLGIGHILDRNQHLKRAFLPGVQPDRPKRGGYVEGKPWEGGSLLAFPQ